MVVASLLRRRILARVPQQQQQQQQQQVRTKSSSPDPSLLNSAASLVAGLRWRAANALTASLSSQERDELLGRLQPQPTDDKHAQEASLVLEHSIAEAVAAARVEEAQRQAKKWETEKATILAEAEAAAQARVENDLALQQRAKAFAEWKASVERESALQEASAEVHPILGPVVAHLGYKRVHLASAQALMAIPVWKKQRTYRHDRAKAMAKDKLKTLHLGMPGVIGIYESADGQLSILDGQHRVGMMTILEQKADKGSIDLQRILVEVFPHQPDKDLAEELFVEVNKAEPVKLVDMPGVAKVADRRTINDGAARLAEAFPDMFSSSQRCRSPHLNIDNLRDAVFAADVLTRHSLTTAKALEEWMLAQNAALADKYAATEAQALVPATALKKAQTYNFYLGLESSWLYN